MVSTLYIPNQMSNVNRVRNNLCYYIIKHLCDVIFRGLVNKYKKGCKDFCEGDKNLGVNISQ
jgi:hypothetical protein